MKQQTQNNIESVLGVLRSAPEGKATMEEVSTKTSLNANQINGAQGVWTNKSGGEVPALWTSDKKEKSLIITEEGRTWAFPTKAAA
jgi:hypothetical protein